MSFVFLSVAMVYPFKSEFMVLHALVQAGAGNSGQVVAKGFGAGQVLVDGALGFTGDGGGRCGKLRLVLGAVFAFSGFLGGRSLPTQNFRFLRRIQRFPNRLLRLMACARCEAGCSGPGPRRVRVFCRDSTPGAGDRGRDTGMEEMGRTINVQAFR